MSKARKPAPTVSPAAEKVVDFLNANPGWHTVKDIDAGLGGAVARATIAKALKASWEDGKDAVRRDVSEDAKGQPVRWAGSTTTPPPSRAGDAVGTAPEADPSSAAVATGTDRPDVPDHGNADDDSTEVNATPDATGAPEDEATSPDTSAEASTVSAGSFDAETTTEKPSTSRLAEDPPDDDATPHPTTVIPAAALPPNPQVIAVAGILGDHAEEGITASALSEASGVAIGLVWRILISADITGAAVSDKPYVLDTAAKWRPGEGDVASVNPAEAPSHVDCPCCGQTKRVPAGRATSGQSGGGARGGVCADGAAALPPGGLTRMVADWVAANPDTDITPGKLTEAIGARSSGAVLNALVKMATTGDAVSEVAGVRPRTFRTAPAQQANSAENA